MYILGLNAYHGDSSACIVKDGELLAALEEERVRRVKHWAGLPTGAIQFCLDRAGIGLDEVDLIAVGRDPRAHFLRKAWFGLTHFPSPLEVIDRLRHMGKIEGLGTALAREFGADAESISRKVRPVEHHRAHLSSAFFVSPFDRATVISVDAMGDFTSTSWAEGNGTRLDISGRVFYPHSLGIFYTALTQYLGFWHYGDEYKVMGLSGFGDPSEFLPLMRKIVRLKKNGSFELDLRYFVHHRKGARMTWNGGAPVIGQLFSPALEKLLGPARMKGEELDERLRNIGAAAQAMYEEAFFHILEEGYRRTKNTNLCLAGGTIQNSLANGKILRNSPFREVYIPPAASDGGNAIGSAYALWHGAGNTRSFVMSHALWGTEYSDEEITRALSDAGLEFKTYADKELFDVVSGFLEKGKVIGWFQGRSEWGPRALGNRSILADPRRKDMKDILNLKIKKREPFRPFAPSILEERVGEYFEETYPVPFMEKVYVIRPEKREELPAVTHVDGTGRLQSVSKKSNPQYWNLINRFGERTGTPIVLNTSFNENEPIVETPREAIDCFLRTEMDVLVMGNAVAERKQK